MEYEHLKHGFKAFYDKDSEILILGSFPSKASREVNFYYGHKANRFWKLLALIYEEEMPLTINDKKDFLRRHKIALYDVIEECDIKGSDDASIRNVIPSDLGKILSKTKIRRIYCNGKLAAGLFERYQSKKTDIQMMALPSTSPANAVYNMDRLLDKWKMIKEADL